MIRPETYPIVLPLALQSGLGTRAVLTFARKRCCASSSTTKRVCLPHFMRQAYPFGSPSWQRRIDSTSWTQRKNVNAGLPDAVVIFPFQRTRLLQNLNKNQEPKTEPLSTFGFGLLVFYLTIFCLGNGESRPPLPRR